MQNSRPLQKILSGSCSTCFGVRPDDRSPASLSPVLTQIYQPPPSLSPSTPLDSLPERERVTLVGETGICQIKDFDWLSGVAPESSEIIGGKGQRRETDGEMPRPAEKITS